MAISVLELIKKHLQKNTRYDKNAYFFVMESLNKTVEKLKRRNAVDPKDRHISAKELSEGIAELAEQRYNDFAYFVLKNWGIENTKDIGIIVFDLIDMGVFLKSDQDNILEFYDVFDLKKRLLPLKK